MMLAQIKRILFVSLFLLTISILFASCTGEENTVPSDPVKIRIYSSSTKEDWINSVAESFNHKQIKTASGKPILVQIFHVNSGGSMASIIHGEIQPTVWSPAELSWVNSANLEWQALTDKLLIVGDCQPTVYEPTGFAMWRPMAEAMGWPTKPIHWSDIFNLASDPDGWARYDHPEWGQFKLGLTNPETSSSGRLILTGLTYAILGKTQGLMPDMVRTEPIVEAFEQLNLHTAEFGEQSARLLERMVIGGPTQLHAINTNEAETLKSNARYGKLLAFPMVFIIPADGTTWGEHPYCILDADWVSPEQREAARLFAAYLLEPEQQILAMEKGLRPTNPSIELSDPITVINGANPEATPLTIPSLESPNAVVAETIKELFVQIRDNARSDQ